MNKRKICVLIPAYNESLILKKTLGYLLKLLKPQDIYVVIDGSTDQTKNTAQKFTHNILNLKSNQGKAKAINLGIKHFNLLSKYQYLMPMDADTKVNPEFFNEAFKTFRGDKAKKICALTGRVIGSNHSYLTSYRLWEYEISQTIHKKAQDKIKAIIVCPGCSTIYRTELLKKVAFPEDSLAEDMDLTFLIHRRKLGRIVFNPQATVNTQDPKTLKNYLKQIDRWYTGFWQCILKYNIPWEGQNLDLEAAILATEGLFSGFTVLALLFLLPFALINNKALIFVLLIIDFLFFFLPSIIFTAQKYRKWEILKYIFHFYFLRFLSGLVFLKSFFKAFLSLDLKMRWNKVRRYAIKEEYLCYR